MQHKLLQYKEKIFVTFWILPLFISLISIALSLALLYIDYNYLSLKKQIIFLNIDSSRTVLSMIASAVITITSVTFSIIVLTLSIASNQLGPRLLPNFMRQKSTQLILGCFIGTFIYAVIILQAMPIENTALEKPYLSIIVGLLLGVICFFLLIYLIHYVCHIIQIDNVLTFLVQDLKKAINRQLCDINDVSNRKDMPSQDRDEHISFHEKISKKHVFSFKSKHSGYIQVIDFQGLMKLATSYDLYIDVHLNCGKFVFENLALLTVYSNHQMPNSLHRKFNKIFAIGKRRSVVQDIEFSFEELSEIALRALSPGINNPYTAIHCLDRVVEGFATLATKAIPCKSLRDKDGEIRILRKTTSYDDIVCTALNRFRQQAEFDLSVVIQLLNMLEKLFQLNMAKELAVSLFNQGKLVFEDAANKNLNEADKKDLQFFYNKCVEKFSNNSGNFT